MIDKTLVLKLCLVLSCFTTGKINPKSLMWVILFIACSFPQQPVMLRCTWTSKAGPPVVAQYLLIFSKLHNVRIYLCTMNPLKELLLLNSWSLSNQIHQKPISSSKASTLVFFQISIRGVKTTLICFKVGSRSLITKENSSHIRSIVRFKTASLRLSRTFSKLAFLGSYAIWNSRKEPTWENISSLTL